MVGGSQGILFLPSCDPVKAFITKLRFSITKLNFSMVALYWVHAEANFAPLEVCTNCWDQAQLHAGTKPNCILGPGPTTCWDQAQLPRLCQSHHCPFNIVKGPFSFLCATVMPKQLMIASMLKFTFLGSITNSYTRQHHFHDSPCTWHNGSGTLELLAVNSGT